MSIEEFGRTTTVLKEYSLAIPILIGLYKQFSVKLPKFLLLLLILLISYIPREILNEYLATAGNNLFHSSYIVIIDLGLLMAVFYVATDNAIRKRLYTLLTMLYGVIWILELIFSPRDQYFQYANLVFNLIFIVVSLLSLWELFDDPKETNIVVNPLFWICSGVLIYNSASMVALFVNNYLIEFSMTKELWIIYSIKLILGIMSYAFYSIGFWKSKSSLET